MTMAIVPAAMRTSWVTRQHLKNVLMLLVLLAWPARAVRGHDLANRFEIVQAKFHGLSTSSQSGVTLLMAELEALNETAFEHFVEEDSSFFPSLYLAWGSCLVGIERAAREGDGRVSAAVLLSETSIPLCLAELQRFALVLAAEPNLRDDGRVRGALRGVESCLVDAIESIWKAVGTSTAAVAGVQTAPFWQTLEGLVAQGVLGLDVEGLRKPIEHPIATPAPAGSSVLEGSSVTLAKATGRLRVTLTLRPDAAAAARFDELRAHVVAPGVESQEVSVPSRRVTRVGETLVFYLPLGQRESTVLQRGSRVRLVVSLGGKVQAYESITVE